MPPSCWRLSVCLLPAIFLMTCGGSALAQALALGLRAGASSTRFVSDEGWEHRLGAAGGVLLSLGLHDLLALQVEFLVAEAGAHFPGNPDGFPRWPDKDVGLTYLQMPVLARLQLRSMMPGFIRPTAHLGPALSVLVSCNYARQGPDRFLDAPEGEPVSCRSRHPAVRDAGGAVPDIGVPFAQPRAYDVGVVAGAGVEVVVGTSLVTFEARYGRGFLSVDRLGIPAARNEGWLITATWSRLVHSFVP